MMILTISIIQLLQACSYLIKDRDICKNIRWWTVKDFPVIKFVVRPQIISIALHQRGTAEALKDKKQIISILMDHAYEIPTYTELIPKL
jgi:hypothetical protein